MRDSGSKTGGKVAMKVYELQAVLGCHDPTAE
jgi:hypothetical protein